MGRSWFSKGDTALETTQEVYDAETYAMTHGFEIALKSPMAQHAPAIHICLGSKKRRSNPKRV